MLDTHALIWFLAGDRRLPARTRAEIEAAGLEAMVSAVSAMEVATKHRLGKLPEADLLARRFEISIEEHGFSGLPISLAQAELAVNPGEPATVRGWLDTSTPEPMLHLATFGSSVAPYGTAASLLAFDRALLNDRLLDVETTTPMPPGGP